MNDKIKVEINACGHINVYDCEKWSIARFFKLECALCDAKWQCDCGYDSVRRGFAR